jgi:hypothetical protein
MAIKLRPCAACKGPVTLQSIDEVSGESGPLLLTVRAMPALKCASGHAGPVHRDFLLWLMAELRERESGLPAGEEKGLLFKKHLCACGKELPAKPERRQSWPFDLVYPDTAPFKVSLEMPVYKCPGCGKEQLRSQGEARKALSHAMVGVCDRAGFPHSG